MKKDPTAEIRKKDHIELAFKSQMDREAIDSRFYYEPIISNLTEDVDISVALSGKKLEVPIWVSSMTGGTEKARAINTNLARACNEYGMAMGLGSCRSLLESDERIKDFAMRPIIGDRLLFANLGVAQIEELIVSKKLDLVKELVKKLEVDGLIIHVNPLQEWYQPEGDRYSMSPLAMIKYMIDAIPEIKLIVKEVGQGMGPASLKALYSLPIEAVDFGAAGGTNFSKLELNRSTQDCNHKSLASVGHSAEEMIGFVNDLTEHCAHELKCHQTIISGGVQNYLDGYYYTQKLKGKSIYGQASAFLKHAMDDYETLQSHVESEIAGLKMSHKFLTLKN